MDLVVCEYFVKALVINVTNISKQQLHNDCTQTTLNAFYKNHL